MTSLSFAESAAEIGAKIRTASHRSLLAGKAAKLIAVSKGQELEKIEAAITAGQTHFGENRVQEAKDKFSLLKQQHSGLVLHLIGPLQSNKAAEAVALFDVIHTIDREKIALAVAAEMQKQGKHCRLLVQVNTGEEPQKAGILPKALPDFLHFCKEEAGLTICGLMCIPPADDNPALHFGLLYHLAQKQELKELSMGMSGDYETAARFGATYIRVGTALFGERG